MFITQCDICRKEVKESFVNAGTDRYLSAHTFCQACGKPVLMFLKRHNMLGRNSSSINLNMEPKDKPQIDPKLKKLFTGTEVAALLEHIDGNVKLVLEGQQAIERKLDRFGTKHDRLEQRVTRSEIRLDTLEAK